MNQALTFDEVREQSRRKLNVLTPTKEMLDQWMATRTAIMFKARFFAVILYEKVLIIWTRDVSTLATDGSTIMINPDYFKGLSLAQRMFAICHEIAHMVLEHCELGWRCQRQGFIQIEHSATILQQGCEPGTLPYIHQLMNYAMDFVINALLTETKVGERHHTWLFTPKITGDMASVKVYRDLWENVPEDAKKKAADNKDQGDPQDGEGDSGPTKPGAGKPGKGLPAGFQMPAGTTGTEQFDEHMEPGEATGKGPAQAAAERAEKREQWKQLVSKAATAARQAGQMAGTMQRFVDSILEPVVSWRELIPATLARSLGSGGYDWKRPDRRYINRSPGDRFFAPSRSGDGCGTVVIGADTSGSIQQRELDMIFGCIKGVLVEARPKLVIILWCDTQVQRADNIEDVGELDQVRMDGAPGGGGTKFEPVFDWVRENEIKPDALIYLTDMEGSFEFEHPSYPVIWASIARKLDAPFGTVIEVPR